MSSLLFVINDVPRGNERAYNALSLVGALSAYENFNVRFFLLTDALGFAKEHQKVPQGC